MSRHITQKALIESADDQRIIIQSLPEWVRISAVNIYRTENPRIEIQIVPEDFRRLYAGQEVHRYGLTVYKKLHNGHQVTCWWWAARDTVEEGPIQLESYRPVPELEASRG